jgi:hypothetical protein
MPLASIQQRLDSAQQLWQRQKPRRYDMRVIQRSMRPFDLKLRVEGQSIRLVKINPRLTPASGLPNPAELQGRGDELALSFTVPALFEQVQQLLNQHRLRPSVGVIPRRPQPPPIWSPCGVFKVDFDARDGHLRSLTYDTFGVIDEEVSIRAALTRLP